MYFVSLAPSSRQNKKYELILSNAEGRTKTYHFGSKGSQTYLDHEDPVKRANYIARHSARENWSEINAGSLSRYILWGDSTDLNTNLKQYLKRFKIST